MPGPTGSSSSNFLGPRGSWKQRYFGARPALRRMEPAYIVDVGTGELGFYRYMWRPPTGASPDAPPLLFAEVLGEKLSLGTNKTFAETFVLDVNGAERFAAELLDRFSLRGGSEASPKDNARESPGGPEARRRNVKILLGLTGQNRASLLLSAALAEDVETWQLQVQEILNEHVAADVLVFVPTAQDEAAYELCATEWLVQHGDLEVTEVRLGTHGAPFAELELGQAMLRADRVRGRPSPGLTLAEFLREFSDLIDSDVDVNFLSSRFHRAARPRLPGDVPLADVTSISQMFRRSPKLMRSLIRSRLFNGTLSAGGGSCQVTIKPDRGRCRGTPLPGKDGLQPGALAALRDSECYSLPLGNKSALTGEKPLWPASQPLTQTMLSAWGARIQRELENLGPRLQGQLRGVYIGISAVFYAAELAGCTGCLLPKAEFVRHLDLRLEALLLEPNAPRTGRRGEAVHDHRGAANLVLVRELVQHVLAESAWVVCKRKWQAQPALLEVDEPSDDELAEELETEQWNDEAAGVEAADAGEPAGEEAFSPASEEETAQVAAEGEEDVAGMHEMLMDMGQCAATVPSCREEMDLPGEHDRGVGPATSDPAGLPPGMEQGSEAIPTAVAELPVYIATWTLGFYLKQAL